MNAKKKASSGRTKAATKKSVKKASAKKAASASKAVGKKAAPKKLPAKAAKKVAAKKAPAKKTAAKKAVVKKPAAKKAPKKPAATSKTTKKAPAKKVTKSAPAKSAPAKATPAKKTAAKTIAAKKPAQKVAASKQVSKLAGPATVPPALKPTKRGAAITGQDAEKFRLLLLSLRHRLRGDVSTMSREALGSEGAAANHAPIHPAEVGTHSFEQEFTLNRLSSDSDHLDRIEAALAKISIDAYGLCEECDGRIPKARLEVIPDTPYCVKCASKLEG